jgi:hypothetical protein
VVNIYITRSRRYTEKSMYVILSCIIYRNEDYWVTRYISMDRLKVNTVCFMRKIMVLFCSYIKLFWGYLLFRTSSFYLSVSHHWLWSRDCFHRYSIMKSSSIILIPWFISYYWNILFDITSLTLWTNDSVICSHRILLCCHEHAAWEKHISNFIFRIA